MDPSSLIVIISLAVIIDLIIGELPAKIHPVVLIGKFIEIFNIFKENYSIMDNRLAGLILTIFLIILFSGFFIIIIWIFKFNNILLILVSSILLSTTFSIKLLISTAYNVKKDLYVDIKQARKSVSYLVSRDTSKLSDDNIISAVIETLTENITDSVVSPIFYTFIFGIIGGILYRVVNTLDAMIGYKNPKNINTGWFPAKLDDVLNYLPARATGFLIVIAAFTLRLNWKNSYKIMVRDAKKTPSPNSGYPMAATAGALNIQLTKPGNYKLGDPINPLKPEIISKTILLTKITIFLFLTISILIFATITIIIF
jgi:adenosylcobinamide-phosphate synthase